jgi:diacylglycerol O-acyltransferase
MSAREIQVYTGITQAPLLLTQLTGLGSRIPAFSTVVSNVPGPRERRYWNGARLDGMYPVSIPFDGGAVNFTVVSNHENLDFGIVACRKSVPHVQRLIDYMEDSLVELEDAAGLRTPSGRRRASPRRKSATRPKAGTKAKTTAKAKAKPKAKPKQK